MSAWQIFKVSRKTFFNPRAWLSVDDVKENNRNLWQIIRDLFVSPSPVRSETFEEAQERFGLSNKEITEIGRNYYVYALLLGFCGILLIVFAFYLLFMHRTGHGFILALAASALCFGQAFRFHFWHFQIKVRKLGCTFEEWRQGKVLNKEEGT